MVVASSPSASSASHSPVAVTAVTDQSLRKAGIARTDVRRCDVGDGVVIAVHLLLTRRGVRIFRLDRATDGGRAASDDGGQRLDEDHQVDQDEDDREHPGPGPAAGEPGETEQAVVEVDRGPGGHRGRPVDRADGFVAVRAGATRRAPSAAACGVSPMTAQICSPR